MEGVVSNSEILYTNFMPSSAIVSSTPVVLNRSEDIDSSKCADNQSTCSENSYLLIGTKGYSNGGGSDFQTKSNGLQNPQAEPIDTAIETGKTSDYSDKYKCGQVIPDQNKEGSINMEVDEPHIIPGSSHDTNENKEQFPQYYYKGKVDDIKHIFDGSKYIKLFPLKDCTAVKTDDERDYRELHLVENLDKANKLQTYSPTTECSTLQEVSPQNSSLYLYLQKVDNHDSTNKMSSGNESLHAKPYRYVAKYLYANYLKNDKKFLSHICKKIKNETTETGDKLPHSEAKLSRIEREIHVEGLLNKAESSPVVRNEDSTSNGNEPGLSETLNNDESLLSNSLKDPEVEKKGIYVKDLINITESGLSGLSENDESLSSDSLNDSEIDMEKIYEDRINKTESSLSELSKNGESLSPDSLNDSEVEMEGIHEDRIDKDESGLSELSKNGESLSPDSLNDSEVEMEGIHEDRINKDESGLSELFENDESLSSNLEVVNILAKSENKSAVNDSKSNMDETPKNDYAQTQRNSDLNFQEKDVDANSKFSCCCSYCKSTTLETTKEESHFNCLFPCNSYCKGNLNEVDGINEIIYQTEQKSGLVRPEIEDNTAMELIVEHQQMTEQNSGLVRPEIEDDAMEPTIEHMQTREPIVHYGSEIFLELFNIDNNLSKNILLALKSKHFTAGATTTDLVSYLKEKVNFNTVNELKQNVQTFLNAAESAHILEIRKRRFFLIKASGSKERNLKNDNSKKTNGKTNTARSTCKRKKESFEQSNKKVKALNNAKEGTKNLKNDKRKSSAGALVKSRPKKVRN